MRLVPSGDGAPLCAECEEREPVGPCAACEAMICGDCGVLTKDPSGTRCICLSCGRLIATVGERRVERASKSPLIVGIALVVLVVFGVAALTGLF